MKKRLDSFLIKWGLISILVAGLLLAAWHFYLAFTTGCIPGKYRDYCWSSEPVSFSFYCIARVIGVVLCILLFWLWQVFIRKTADAKNDINEMTSNKG